MSNQEPVMIYDSTICRHCCACTATCARGALYIDPQTGYLSYDIRKCIRCGNCTRACPSGALRPRPRTVSV